MIENFEMQGLDPNTTIFPTYECFTDAMEFIDHIARLCPEKIDDIVLVHAICQNDGEQEYAHAWVEDTKQKVCIFCGMFKGRKIYFAARYENFFKSYTVKESTRYSVQDAIRENLRTIHFGPWEKKYSDLCAETLGGRRVIGGGFMENVGVIGSLPEPTKKGGKDA